MPETLGERDPHAGARVLGAGVPLEEATAAMILVHGRGASAESILQLTSEIDTPGFSYLAPQAVGSTWYPYSFLSPIPQNEPYLSSALRLIETIVQGVLAAGMPADRLMLLGFSQGACLTLEFAARHARRYGGVVALTGGLIGPDETPRDYDGNFDGTPIFIGSSDPDPHVPRGRVGYSAQALERMGAVVTTRIYPGMGHTVNEDELEYVREMMRAVTSGSDAA